MLFFSWKYFLFAFLLLILCGYLYFFYRIKVVMCNNYFINIKIDNQFITYLINFTSQQWRYKYIAEYRLLSGLYIHITLTSFFNRSVFTNPWLGFCPNTPTFILHTQSSFLLTVHQIFLPFKVVSTTYLYLLRDGDQWIYLHRTYHEQNQIT